MNSPASKRLIDQVPFDVRQSVLQSSEFQRLASDFVHRNVHANAYGVVEMMRNDPAGRYADELSEISGRMDYDTTCDSNDVEIVEDGGSYYFFQWSDLDTILLDGDGDCYLDLKGFAAKHGLNLDAWAWNRETDEPILKSAITEDDDVDVERDLIAAIGFSTADVEDAFSALQKIAEHEGKPELAAQLGDTSAASLKKLFGDFVAEMSVLARDEYDSEEECQQAACEELNLDVEESEVYEHWIVSDRFRYLLEQKGEIVSTDAVDGLTIWGRCTTGQSISMDGVVQRIVAEELSEQVDALVREQFPHLGSDDEYLAGVPVDALKALEEGRVALLTYAYQDRWGREDSAFMTVVLSPRDPVKGWVMDRLAFGQKADSNPGEPVPLAEIESKLQARGTPVGDGLKEVKLGQEAIDNYVSDIAWYHERNKGSELHKVPDRLQERLAKLSPAYAQKLDAEQSGPSLG